MHYRKKGIIAFSTFERAVSECQKHAKAVVLGFFGEQLLHPNYVNLLMYLKKRSFKLIVNTNVSICTKEIMKAWIDAQVDEVRFSLDAINSKTYNMCRPGPVQDFEGKNIENSLRLEVINEKIKYWLSIPRHRPTRLVYVKSSFNKNDRTGFIKYWQPRIKKQDHLLLKQVLSYGGKIKNPYVQKHKCNIWDVGYLMIGWNGAVSPCNLDINLELNLGNIKKATISKLYTGVRANRFRKMTGCGNKIKPCDKCIDANNWSKNEIIKGK
jgi:radical SAM protein with 4Fe4S-binding SPASM domain